MSNCFNDDEYFEKVFDSAKNRIDSSDYKKIEKAFELAHDVRKFEIELFWKRGTYFWAFILASFTAYFMLFEKILGDKCLTLCTLIRFPSLSKILLLLLSCMCFIFCISWVLINKGSKFWQKNWEAHIDVMEDLFSGKLYKTILNTETDEFDKSALRKSAYDYSVTKITTVTSIILMVVSAVLSIFHFILLFLNKRFCQFVQNNEQIFAKILGILISALILFCIYKLKACKGNLEEKQKQGKWRQRK
ncbi:hypothetical protein [uncultured Treponema sp.]|uniref:RipA family octameric membrane protein n=1 Tax=uncultured Treponema sp. TaxID=162155 RepID=UPI0025CFF49A|nr:hypothetical protein [uncultured Treponema sp.]